MKGECAIFADVVSQLFKSLKQFALKIKDSSSNVKKGIFATVALVAIAASLLFTGARVGYKVKYDGKVIATVSSKSHFDDALRLIEDMVVGDGVENTVKKPQFSTSIVLSNNINDAQEVADAIIDNTDAIVAAATLYVNGDAVVTAEKSLLEEKTNQRLNSFNVEGQSCNSRFADQITTKEGYFIATDLADEQEVNAAVATLSVVTEMRDTRDVVVPYKSVVQSTKEQVVGYKKVTVSGVSGLNRVTEDVVMLNGEVQSTTTVDTQVVVAPVNEVIVKGTAKSEYSAKQQQQANNAAFAFPLPSGTWQVSSYYGDGRNHKGVDLRAPSGTSIFAVADGTVTYSGWRGDYGYCVVVEHSNGLSTLYAHARQLCCKVGDKVSQGEIIALVGTTGQSTGNHLHFEVISGGRKVNPAPYINLK